MKTFLILLTPYTFSMRLVLITVCLLPCFGFPQLELMEGEGMLPDPPVPGEREEVELDRNAVQALTRHIQGRTGLPERPPQKVSPEQRERFHRVMERLKKGPEEVRVRITFEDGRRVAGYIPNHMIEIETYMGNFPIRWSEIRHIIPGKESTTFILSDQETINGRLLVGQLPLEREDASVEELSLVNCRELLVFP